MLIVTTTLQALNDRTSERISLEYQDQFLTVPADARQYLQLLYGEDWHIPRKDWSHANYSNITE